MVLLSVVKQLQNARSPGTFDTIWEVSAGYFEKPMLKIGGTEWKTHRSISNLCKIFASNESESVKGDTMK